MEKAVQVTVSNGHKEVVADDCRILGFLSDKPSWRSGNLLHIGDYVILDSHSGLPYVGKYTDTLPEVTDMRLVRVVGVNLVD
jgi:hypothetical protein